jgi:hypothetical protein
MQTAKHICISHHHDAWQTNIIKTVNDPSKTGRFKTFGNDSE